jgi:glycosyltransferase involved in cell wall biosynthesis
VTRGLDLILPGSPGQLSGGTVYDMRMADGLRRLGWDVRVHGLGVEAIVGDRGCAAFGQALEGIADGGLVVVDGLAMARAADQVRAHHARLSIVALVHLLVADEPTVGPAERERLLAVELDALRASAGVIVTSPFTAARVADLGVDPALVRVVAPGTDPVPRATGPGPGAPPRLLCVAAVTPGKGQDVLVRALARLVDVPWDCVCAGSLTRAPAFAGAVQGLARDLGLADRIGFPGEVGRGSVAALYRTSSVFVLPTSFESYGMALCEAMAHGLPLVTTRAGAIPETVPADAAIFVAPGDDEALAEAIRRLLVDAPGEPGEARARRGALGAAGRRQARGLPDREQASRSFAAAVTELAAAGPARHGRRADTGRISPRLPP